MVPLLYPYLLHFISCTVPPAVCVVTFCLMSLLSLMPVFLVNVTYSCCIFSYMGIVSCVCVLPSLSASLPLSLYQCQQYREQASVLENQPTGTFVLQVHAVDADEGANGKVKYGLMHRDSAMPAFRIHPDTGRAVVGCLG